jgi:hypothetical protein
MITLHTDNMDDIKAHVGSRVVAVAWRALGMVNVWHVYDIVRGGPCRAEAFSRRDAHRYLRQVAKLHDHADLLDGEAA